MSDPPPLVSLADVRVAFGRRVTRPASGRCSPSTTRSSVVLPAPLGPMMVTISPGATAELDEPAIAKAVLRRADELGFAVERQTIEVRGCCPRCRQAA